MTESTSGDVKAVSWTTLDIDETAQRYWDVVAPELRADGLDPETEKPTHDWLREHGFGTLLYALRTYHDRTFGDFWAADLGCESPDAGYDWSTDDDRTVDALTGFLDSRRTRKGLAESSLDTLRYRLDRYVRAYRDTNGHADLLSPVARDAEMPVHEAIDECWAAFDRLHDELDSGRTKRRIHGVVENWYAHLVRRKRARTNPAAGLDEEYDWRETDPDPPHLDDGQVRRLYETASSEREELLVLALCAWGLRSGEVARLHRSNFVFDEDVAHLSFEERKNGPGQVSLLYGLDPVKRRFARFADREDWRGYLFPSPTAGRDHVSRWTVWNWFTDLADDAGIDAVDGENPVPQMGRRFWYDAYSSSLEVVVEGLDDIAAEQGSSSAEVVLQNYLSDARVRSLRREHMRERLSAVFGDSE
ncbi:tyrosine-type recombinase/integrase [Haloarchaeobius sp. TZWSO28]|uniref:tyrosine-type recombinase/integrase n=1 Tax=Haloarchaeobius sp. TZWSO28 TaxID=3446119 RepID=UPI003EBF70B3